jgi:MFS family permease
MHVLGNALQTLFTLGTGLSNNATQIIIIRALCGVSSSFCLPSAVSLVISSFPKGKRRNVAFASMGGGLPIGFSIGLIMGGLCAGTIGWEWGFYITAILNLVVLVLLAWKLPVTDLNNPSIHWNKLRTDVDWLGVALISSSLGLLLYVLS